MRPSSGRAAPTATYRLMRSRAVPLRGEDGADRWAGPAPPRISRRGRKDEEARREAEEALRESEELHRLTLEMSAQIVWTAEADGSGLALSAPLSASSPA